MTAALIALAALAVWSTWWLNRTPRQQVRDGEPLPEDRTETV